MIKILSQNPRGGSVIVFLVLHAKTLILLFKTLYFITSQIIIIFITSNWKIWGIIWHISLVFNICQGKFIFLRKGISCHIKIWSWLPVRHLSWSWVFSAGVPTEAGEGFWTQMWSYPATRTSHPKISQSSESTFFYNDKSKVKHK